MPIYDYVCSACEHRLEVIHGVDEAGPRFCPVCGADGTMRKLFVPPAIHFKGSGWAKKDRSATSAPGKAASAAKATDAKGAEAKGADSKASAAATSGGDATTGSTSSSGAPDGD